MKRNVCDKEERVLAFTSAQAKQDLKEDDKMIDVVIEEVNKFELMLEPDTDENLGPQLITATVNVKQATVARLNDIFKTLNLPLPGNKKKKSLFDTLKILKKLQVE